MKKILIIFIVLACTSTLNALSDLQFILPILNGGLFGYDPSPGTTIDSHHSDSDSKLTLKSQTFFNESGIGFYVSLSYANQSYFISNAENNNGLKLAVGPSFKIKEKEKYNMYIGTAPQVTFYPNSLFTGVEIDFQTKFYPTGILSPMTGFYSDINFFRQKTKSTKESTFYLNIGFQFYIALCINLN